MSDDFVAAFLWDASCGVAYNLWNSSWQQGLRCTIKGLFKMEVSQLQSRDKETTKDKVILL